MLRHEYKQQRFCEEYLKDRNGLQAAIRAGYSNNPATAKTTASRLLTYANVKAILRAKDAAMSLKLDLSLERVLMNLAEACELAREQGRPDIMVSSACEISRLLQLNSVPAKDATKTKELSAMTDEQLYALLEAEG